jgi:formylglycine-generating enzyme required for sulfatase activity
VYGALALRCAPSERSDPGSRVDAASSSSSAASAPAGSGVPSAQPAAPATGVGACAGRPAGAHTCDGARLLRCTGSGDPELERTCFDIEKCDAERGGCEPACPKGEVYVPPTDAEGFVMGRGMTPFGFGSRASGTKGRGQADTPHRVVLTKPFCMDATEVTAGAVVACVQDQGCPAPSILDRWATYPKKLDYPVNMVSWPKAKVFCEKQGKSLPTEAQWEWAATGGDRRKWPWGNEPPNCQRADFTVEDLVTPGGDHGCHGGGPSPVGAHPEGDRILPTGRIHDLGGNVWEWCLDSYLPYSGQREVDPLHLRGEGGNHVVRGGGWNRSARGITTAFRGAAIVTYQVPGLGFRCVRNPR